MPWPKGKPFPAEMVAKRSRTYVQNGKRRRKAILAEGERLWCCSKCRIAKPEVEYHRDDRTANGLKSQCKACHSETSNCTRNPGLHAEAKRRSESRRRARKVNVGAFHITAKQLVSLCTVQGARCLKCCSPNTLQWDHILPLALGGVHALWNLQLLCRPCNEQKQARYADFRSGRMRIFAVLEFKVHQSNVDDLLKRRAA